ncbi:MAG: Calx-beta domain-containing protein, partial [Chloroflexota bacterium]
MNQNRRFYLSKQVGIIYYALLIIVMMGVLAVFRPSNASRMTPATVSVQMGTAAENSVGVPYTITITALQTEPVTVTVRSNNGSARTGVDFIGIFSKELVIEPSSLTVSDQVLLIDDTDIETDENLSISIIGVESDQGDVTIGSPSTATGRILDDDPNNTPIVGLVGGQAVEASGSIPFTVTLDSAVAYPITVSVKTEDGSAETSDSDYQVLADFDVVIDPGQILATGQINLNDDSKVEADETVSLEVQAIDADGATINDLPDPVTLSILNDDSATITLSAPSDTMEGNSGQTPFVFDVSLDNPVDGGFQIDYESNSGTATVSNDFVDNDGTLTFAGTSNEAKQITVNVIGDTVVEGQENFSVSLKNLASTSLGSSISVDSAAMSANIIDDDSAGIAISNTQLNESDADGQTLSFDVTLTAGVSGSFT